MTGMQSESKKEAKKVLVLMKETQVVVFCQVAPFFTEV